MGWLMGLEPTTTGITTHATSSMQVTQLHTYCVVLLSTISYPLMYYASQAQLNLLLLIVDTIHIQELVNVYTVHVYTYNYLVFNIIDMEWDNNIHI